MPDQPETGPGFTEACAKINLTLDVLGKRADGYHDLASVMQAIALYDTLWLDVAPDGRLECITDAPELDTASNLVLRAADRLRREVNRSELGVRIDLHKEIPVQGGLGGGSSDAASTLIHLNELWELGVSRNRLLQLAAELGSDVPFFIYGGTALIEGRGEYVTPLPVAEPLWLVLAKPAIGVSTPLVFGNLTPEDYSTGSDTNAVVAAIRRQERIPFEHLTNALQPGVLRTFPEIAELKRQLLEAGAPLVCLCGSGPSLFAPFRRLKEASEVFRHARELELPVRLTHTIYRPTKL